MKMNNVKNYLRFFVIIFLGSLLSNSSFSASTYVGGDCQSINGLYVSLGQGGSGDLLGNTTQENALLKFSRDNGFNYLIFYDLNGLAANSTRATQLASLVSRARLQYGIQQIGAALGGTDGANNIVAYNNSHASHERIDVLNLESEFWNEADVATAFNNVINILGSFRSLAQANNMETEIYIGWIDANQGARLGNAVDRVLVHFYRQSDTDIINYGIERLQYLAGASRKVRIAPIFSSEGPTNTADVPFMGTWLETHPNDQAFKSWFAGYNANNSAWKSNIEIMGASWFLYQKFLDLNVGKPNHITSNPVSQTACTGDTKTFTVASSATTKNYCWMKDDRCLTDGSNISGARTAALTIANITASDFGNYTPRVISYDSSNPTSFAATTASLTAAASCGGNTSTNLALNKPVTASSYIAAGYEPTKVNDGNSTATRWASAYSGAQWIQVDLGATYNVNRVKISWENAYATTYQILTSADGTNWSTARTVNGNSSLVNDNTGLTTIGRYVRIYGTANALPAWGYSMYELEVYGTAATSNSNRALNKPVTVSSVEAAGLEGSKAVDGNGTSRWASAYTDTQWIQVDMGATYSVSRVKISWEAAYGKNFKVQISPNGTTWADLRVVNNNTALVNDFTGLSGNGRYIRVNGTKRATTYGYSIYELEVY